LVAATITPICFPFIFGKWIVAPAILITLALFDGTNPQFGLLFGLLPILTIAALIFASWSVVTSRNITKNQPPNGF